MPSYEEQFMLDAHGTLLRLPSGLPVPPSPTIYAKSPLTGKKTAVARAIVVYTLLHGPVPRGWVVEHKNDNVLDCHPDNLIATPQKDYVQAVAAQKALQKLPFGRPATSVSTERLRHLLALPRGSNVDHLAKRWGCSLGHLKNLRSKHGPRPDPDALTTIPD
jgi:hypothetical protein